MSETDTQTKKQLTLSELRQQLPHLVEMSQDGWCMKWGAEAEPPFEIVCRKANIVQLEEIERLMGKGYNQALMTLRP